MLTKENIRKLKKMAQPLKAQVQVGKGGLNDGTLKSIAEHLAAHELSKVQILPNAGLLPKDIGPELAEALDAHLVQIIGRVVILYKAKEKDPKILL